LTAQYGAGVRPVDFESATAAAQINDWVRAQTAGRITRLFDSLDPATALVLANTVYLEASWAQSFAEDPVTDEPFARAGGGTVKVPMMHRTGEFRYAGVDGWQAIDLPYASGDLMMRLLLPAPGGSPVDMLDPAMLARTSAALASVRNMPTMSCSPPFAKSKNIGCC
jgi:serpin B